MDIATVSSFTSNPRAILRRIKEPGLLYEVHATYDGRKYYVFNISLWDEEHDAKKAFVEITARELDDHAAFIIHTSRDLMFRVVVTVHGQPKYIIEPRKGATWWVRDRLGQSRADWRRVILRGRLTAALKIGDVRKAERLRDSAAVSVETIQRKNDNLTTNMKMFENKTAIQLAQISGVSDISRVQTNIADNERKWSRQLEELLTANNIPIPPRGR